MFCINTLALGKVDRVEAINTEAGQRMIHKAKGTLGDCFATLITGHPTLKKMTIDFREDDVARSIKALLKNRENETVIMNYGGAHDMSRAFEKAGLSIERNEVSILGRVEGENFFEKNSFTKAVDNLMLGLKNTHLIGNHLYCLGRLKLGVFNETLEEVESEIERLDKIHHPEMQAVKDKNLSLIHI